MSAQRMGNVGQDDARRNHLAPAIGELRILWTPEARAQTSPANGSFHRRGASPHRAFRLAHTRRRYAVLIASMANAVQWSGEGGLCAKFADCLFRANRWVILLRYGKFTTWGRLSSG
jgi:hypothetical protein